MKQMLLVTCMSISVLPVLPRGQASASPVEGRTSGTTENLTLEAREFGVKADGKTDDGPAIARMLAAARMASGFVTLSFPEKREIYIKSCPERYVFALEKISDFTIDGAGCTFLLDPYVRFLDLRESQNIIIRGLQIDFSPLPFACGKITAKSPKGRSVEVALFYGRTDSLLGGPTREDGEQAYFSMLWNPGPYSMVSRHYWTEQVESTTRPGTVRVRATENFKAFSEIRPGVTQISIPVSGIAHRFGPGACLQIYDCRDVSLEDVEVWSAPWFGFRVFRNEGGVTFKRVHIRPKPGTRRLMSTWRDGFHVKGNRGRLLWEDCRLIGMNDDAFNISTHSRMVKKILSPTEILLQQLYPLEPIPWRTGEDMFAADPQTKTLRTSAVVKAIKSEPRLHSGRPAAPLLTVKLNRPIPELQVGDTVWQPASTNPDTTLRRCYIEQSCRLQTPVVLEDSEVRALLWFYGESIEGPFPSNFAIRNSRLYRGRGNREFAVVISGEPKHVSHQESLPLPRAIHNISIIGNEIYGGFSLKGAEKVRMENNRLLEKGAKTVIEQNEKLQGNNNTVGAERTF